MAGRCRIRVTRRSSLPRRSRARSSRARTRTDEVLAVRAHSVSKCFGEVVALDGVDLAIAQGQVHGLVGPNGAGKTTLLGLLLGLAEADDGELEILGSPVRRTLVLPEGVAGWVDGPGLYPSLTAKQNLVALAH